MLRKFFSRKGAPEGAQGAAQGPVQGPAQGSGKWETDPAACLSDAQDRLAKLKNNIRSPDAFPSINEATRRVNQLDAHVHALPESDPLKPVWTQQLRELQTELHTLTEAIMSSMGSTQPEMKTTATPHSVPRAAPDAPEPVEGLDMGGDLFSGLMVSAGGPASSQPESQAAAPANTGPDIRPALDEDLFSNLEPLETAVSQEGSHPQDAGTGVLASATGHAETSVPKSLPQAPTPAPDATKVKEPPKAGRRDYQPQPASPASSSTTGTGKKKKKASRTVVGYGRGEPAARPSRSPADASTGYQTPPIPSVREETGSVLAAARGGMDLTVMDLAGVGDVSSSGNESGLKPGAVSNDVPRVPGSSPTSNVRGDQSAVSKTESDKFEVQQKLTDSGNAQSSDVNVLGAHYSLDFSGMTMEQPSEGIVAGTSAEKSTSADFVDDPGLDFAGLSLSSPLTAEAPNCVTDGAEVGAKAEAGEACYEHQTPENIQERSEQVPTFLASLRGLQSTTERFLQKAAEKSDSVACEERVHLEKRTKLLIDLTATKELIKTLEQQQALAVDNEDFDAAAKLATKIDDNSSLLGQCLGDLQQVGKDLESCIEKRVKLMEDQVSHRKGCIDSFRALQAANEEEAACVFARKKEEFERGKARRTERDAEISAAESIIPEKRLALEKERDALLEENSTEKKAKEEERAALEQEQAALEEEINTLRSQLEAKVAKLEEVSCQVSEVSEGLESMQGQLEASLQALADSEAAVVNEEKELAKSRLEIEDEFMHGHDIEKKAQEERDEAVQQAKFAGDEAATHETQLCVLESVIKRQTALRALLSRVHSEAEDARSSLKDMRGRLTAKRGELRALASDKAKVAQKKIAAEDQVAQVDLRLPQIEADKKAAAANKDFQEAARLSGEAKKLASERETALSLSTALSRQLTDLEENEGKVAQEVSDLEGEVKSAAWQNAKCQWCCFRIEAEASSICELDWAGNGADQPNARLVEDGQGALEDAAQQLAAEFGFKESHIEAVMQELKSVQEVG
ncbi:unnamed protein product [Ostreobium quekettii]|uniref:UVR domain-containing protein n=1 Tax=Ostreobium quekettii TaxID=121088 RepID=A0A8S1J7N9_9CHLO|nr:unnamed protein product [Ostreobium quekettii]|eukprot:evm.model.scf_550.3 EVM.evm.TU.scf_550.3   scf_550:32991-41296(-)